MLQNEIWLRIHLTERPQVVGEGPVGDRPALLPCLFIRKAEMDALVDADIDRIFGQIRKAIKGARLLYGPCVSGGECEGHVIRPEEVREGAGQRAAYVIKARGVVRIGRSGN